MLNTAEHVKRGCATHLRNQILKHLTGLRNCAIARCTLHADFCKALISKAAVSFCDYGGLTWSIMPCLQEVAKALSSHLDSAEVVQQQACIRPLSPDGSPIIGQHPHVAGAYIATGVSITVVRMLRAFDACFPNSR